MNSDRDKHSLDFITVLSVLSAISVITLHTNGVFWQFSRERYWITANIIESVFYFAVPVFFMISGATLLDFPDRYDIVMYFKKRIRKTIIPFFFWSSIGLGYRLYVLKDFPVGRLRPVTLWNLIITTKIIPIYWFFIPLFALYLCIPAFAYIPKEAKHVIFPYLISLGLLINVTIPFVIKVFHWSFQFPIGIDVARGYLLYLLLGYWFTYNEFNSRSRKIIYLLGVLGLIAHIGGTYALSMKTGKIIQTYKGYTNLPCVLYSLSIFLVVKENASRLMNRFKYIFMILKDYTFAIYLLHWFVMTALVKGLSINVNSIVYRLGAPYLIASISIVIIFVFRKILGSKLLP